MGESNGSKKPLTKDQILKVEEGQKVFQLPSGMAVQVAFLSWNMAQEIEESIELEADEDKERIFTEKVISWILRESDQKDLWAFSIEDQSRLVEIAAEEWGCKEEYQRFVDIKNSEVRFYQAARQKEKEISMQLFESARAITETLVSSIAPLINIQIDLASSLCGLQDHLGEARKLDGFFDCLNERTIEQMEDIYRLQSPILGIAEEITKMQCSSVISDQSSFLTGLGDTITSYQNLMKDILPIERFSVLLDTERYYPTIEMHNTSIVTGDLITADNDQPEEEIITPDNVDLVTWLGSLDPSFPVMLRGAEGTIYSHNSDRCRHFASSHRELCTQIIHLLAPDNLIKDWTTDPNHFDKGKPTRRARLLYIARNYNNHPFIDFFVKNFEIQMSLLNTDEHRKKHEYVDEDLLLLHKHFLSALGFLRRIVTSQSS